MKPKLSLSFQQEKKIYFVNDECEETLVIVCIKAGCGQEPSGKNGIAHLVEHICLSYRKYIPSSCNSSLIFNEIRSSGFTNYGQTVLMFSFPSHMDNINMFHQILMIILSNAIITNKTFEISKLELLAECKQKGSQWYWQQELISFITNSQINELPVGKVDEIVQLQMKDAVTFIQNNYTNDNLALIYFTGLQVPEIISNLNQTIPCVDTVTPNSLNHHELGISYGVEQQKFNLSICRLEHPTNLKVVDFYYQQTYQSVNLKEKLTRMLFEIITKISIDEYVSVSPYANRCSDVSVKDKHVSAYFYYAVFTLTFISIDDTISTFAEDVAYYLKRLLITEEKLKASKESISPFLCEPEKPSRVELFQNISSHFFYGEPIHITCEHYNQLKELLDKIEVSDLMSYKNWILNAPCKIVIST
ncbi:insulinase family protein [Paenibacillus sp. FSL F4-0243]|uniref:insulinase family protein n=1 Tax=Paenibacillus sp. FSL F4-0243 TaxID=2954732 RepID=UPI0030DC6B6E